MNLITKSSSYGKRVNGSEIVSCKFVNAMRETMHVIKATKEAFDDIAFTMKMFAIRIGHYRV